MKKMILLLLMVPVFVMAQPTITFIPSDGITLTAEDVASTFVKNGLTKEDTFHAISDAVIVGEWAFYERGGLISVDFPLAIEIEYRAFKNCSTLVSINFPLVTIIGNDAFSGCPKLTSVSFPLATTVGSMTFSYCENLTSVSFPLATTIGGYAFEGCENLTSVSFPLVTTIGGYAFGYCENLTSISFPLTTTIGGYAFDGCENLTSVSFGTDFNTETEIVFGNTVFGGPHGNGPDTPILTPNIDLTLGEYVLPLPDMMAKTWQNTNFAPIEDSDYIWKSINIYTGVKEGISNQYVFYLGNNRYGLENIKQAELYDIMGNLVKKYDNEYSVDLIDLSNGVYLLRYLTDNNKIKTEKIVKK